MREPAVRRGAWQARAAPAGPVPSYGIRLRPVGQGRVGGRAGGRAGCAVRAAPGVLSPAGPHPRVAAGPSAEPARG